MSTFHAKIAAWLMACPVLAASAAEPVVNLHSTVSGSVEQPRVMYLVPWQAPDTPPFEYAPDHRLLREVFAPIDRDEFVRELHYQDNLRAASAQPQTTSE
jgi:hypothetical protein